MMSKKGAKSHKDQPSYALRDVVLAKIRGYPPWPGMASVSYVAKLFNMLTNMTLQIIDPETVPENVLKERPVNKKTTWYCVRFFPAGDQCVHILFHARELKSMVTPQLAPGLLLRIYPNCKHTRSRPILANHTKDLETSSLAIKSPLIRQNGSRNARHPCSKLKKR